MKSRDAALILFLTIVIAVLSYLVGVRDGENNDTGKAPDGPVSKLVPLHEFYGPLDPHAEDDAGWNCLTQGGRSC